ncbi:hypothetical protein C8J57DRAFT_1477674 [Mycena rebaudengoi]|nr:hypothetical protein C8J57DRAFT_1477674 [Mycena rebaudengoi]
MHPFLLLRLPFASSGSSLSLLPPRWDPEVLAMLNKLIELKESHQSGNGWKSSVWTLVISAVQAANPTAESKKDQKKVKSKLDYLKATFEDYLFVKKLSGTGWDDEEKHATGTTDYIDGFAATHGQKYERCFETPCPYTLLDTLYDGMKNRATGDNAIIFGRRKSSRKKTPTEQENGGDTSGSTASNTTPSNDAGGRVPMTELNIGVNDDREAYDDELSRKPSQRTRSRTRAISEHEDEGDSDAPKARKRHKSDSSAGPTSTPKRNAARIIALHPDCTLEAVLSLSHRITLYLAFPGFNVVPQNFRRAAFQNYCSSHPKSINDARQVFFGGNRRAQLPYINMGLHTDLHYTVATLPQNRCIDVLDDGAVQRERPQQVRTSIERRGKDLVYRALG